MDLESTPGRLFQLSGPKQEDREENRVQNHQLHISHQVLDLRQRKECMVRATRWVGTVVSLYEC